MKDEIHNINLRSEDVQEILGEAPAWLIRYGNLIILLVILMIFLFSFLIKSPDEIEASGYLTTIEPLEKIYAPRTEKIDFLNFTDGEYINKGETIAILKNSANYKDIDKLKIALNEISLQDDSFEFPVSRMMNLELGELEGVYSDFITSYLEFSIINEKKPHLREHKLQEKQINEMESRLNTLKIQREISSHELKIKNKELERRKILFKKDVISETELEQNQLNFLAARKSFNSVDMAISQLKESIANLRGVLVNDGISSSKQLILLQKRMLASYKKLKTKILEWEDQFLLKSNINGELSYFMPWEENQLVNEGDLIFTILPKEAHHYISRLQVPSESSGKIKNGMEVHLEMNNFPKQEFGILKGTVQNITVIPDDDGLYIISVKLPEKLITNYDFLVDFKHEMRINGRIITQKHRLIERLFQSITDQIKN
ncbi:HlyD family efflux transporter periplasmic adaptor subunit [Zunongwangia profunda]|jgi:multidrug efflux pump subunit AcrA (membrane-fusion protein)|uniref:HlyD family efflux transporter periplasmic adaptor subunit n=1 Tax=Zunongwangia profunda TaxID=398743 RepID=UPI001D18EB11|nr:HlyD family secretion protein [Zunongwangia profunda]MCC4228982.1 HlyD family efflux transporter periplasmic adaptor subunit [Zunongwangia profunda]|tara:strand:- start:1915 stop:3207 length:1293 start_codon:yes stop_codon:yes gene_type:complete